MKDVSTKWYYESDGDEHRRTHYLCNEALDSRVDCGSRSHAILLRDALNSPPAPGETLSAYIVRLLTLWCRNLHAEGWGDEEAVAIIRTALSHTAGTLAEGGAE